MDKNAFENNWERFLAGLRTVWERPGQTSIPPRPIAPAGALDTWADDGGASASPAGPNGL